MAAVAAAKPLLNPATFPRPPKLEPVGYQLQVKWKDTVIASTNEAFWVLETFHPPTYYLPRESISPAFADKLSKSSHSSYCEWKGRATYWDLRLSSQGAEGSTVQGEEKVRNRIWSYERPTKGFLPIKDYLSFYAGPWQCFVDDEEVVPQPGDFYGGWTTSNIETKYVKGAAGTRHW